MDICRFLNAMKLKYIMTFQSVGDMMEIIGKFPCKRSMDIRTGHMGKIL